MFNVLMSIHNLYNTDKICVGSVGDSESDYIKSHETSSIYIVNNLIMASMVKNHRRYRRCLRKLSLDGSVDPNGQRQPW